jgi:hypothetical protein
MTNKQADFESLSPETVVMACDFVVRTSGDGFWSKKVKDVRVHRIEYDEEFDGVNVYFDTLTWDVRKDGLIYTDDGFEMGVIVFLYQFWPDVNWSMLQYTEQGMQGEDYVSMELIDG